MRFAGTDVSVEDEALCSGDEVQEFEGLTPVVLGESDAGVIEPGECFHGR